MTILTPPVEDFLASVPQVQRVWYYKRDNCGPAALDLIEFAKKRNVQLARVRGCFTADVPVSAKADFTPEMKQQLIDSGLDFNNEADRNTFINSNQEYAEEWKNIPHFWTVDSEGAIHDPSGYYQFVRTALAADTDRWRYVTE